MFKILQLTSDPVFSSRKTSYDSQLIVLINSYKIFILWRIDIFNVGIDHFARLEHRPIYLQSSIQLSLKADIPFCVLINLT